MGLFGNSNVKKILKEASKREANAQSNAKLLHLRCPRCGAVSMKRVVHNYDQFKCNCGYILTPADRF